MRLRFVSSRFLQLLLEFPCRIFFRESSRSNVLAPPNNGYSLLTYHFCHCNALPLWGPFLSILIVVLLSVDGGYRLGKYRRGRHEQEKEAPLGTMYLIVIMRRRPRGLFSRTKNVETKTQSASESLPCDNHCARVASAISRS
jgi:hypothetical protein